MWELGFTPKRSLGQNFLINPHGVDKIIEHTLLSDNPHILEVGPGFGALTDALIPSTPSLTLVELDSALADYWRSREQKVIECDILKCNWSQWEKADPCTLVSNLPYQVSSRLVIEVSLSAPFIKNMVLMFQKEVAERISSPPQSKNYGFLSIISQSFWSIDKVMDLSPQSFYPPPRVASRVLSFHRLNFPPVKNAKAFVTFVKCGFSHRRKLLAKNLLSPRIPHRVDPAQALEEMGWNPHTRAEDLNPQQFVDLFKKVCGDSSAKEGDSVNIKE